MTGLIGWWPLHENTGSTARDLSGNGNHGTLNGGVTQGVAGKGGLTAYSFDGNDDYVDTSLSFNKSSFTYSGWVKPENPNKDYWADLIDCYDINDSSDWARLAYRGGDAVFFTDSGGSGGGLTELRGGTITTDWHHLVGLRDIEAGRLKLYVDGNLVNSTSTKSDGLIDGSYNEVIGRRTDANNGEQVKGKLNDIRIYDRALSPQEIQKLYEWGSGDYTDRSYHDGSDSGAVSRWKFDGDVADSWGSNDGTDNTSAGFTSDAIRGQAKKFDGGDDIVDLGSWGVPTQEFTVSSWIKSSDVTSHQVIMEQWASSDGNFILDLGYTNSTARLLVEDSGNTNYTTETPAELKNNEWYHIAGGYDGSKTFIYINGVLRASNQLNITRNTESYATGIGADPSNSQQYFNGRIDDVRVYSRTFSPSEIFQLYQWGTRGRDMRKLTVNSRGDQ